MRVLWITHDILRPFLPYVEGKPSQGSSWVEPLFFNIMDRNLGKLGIITPVVNGKYQRAEIDNILYYSIKIHKKDNIIPLSETLISKYLLAINDFKPDIIHIHGTEKNFAQLRRFVDTNIPIVCSIQGIINSYYPYLQSSISNLNLKKYYSLKNWLGIGGVNKRLKEWYKYSFIEREIISLNKYFIGRTLWDKAQLSSLNPKANYFHGEELLRPAFSSLEWNINDCVKHRIFASSASYPIKGFHVLLYAVDLLKNKYPNIQLVAPLAMFDMKSSTWKDKLIKEDYANFLKKEIIRLKLKNHVIMCKRFNEKEMAESYKQANVFVLPSYVENSPNSLGEAMMVGTPVIASFVGGIQTIVKDEESALLFPTGDFATLAYQIDKLFSDDKMAIKLSKTAKMIAKKRHNIVETTNQYISIYNSIINIHNEGSSSF